MKIEFLTRVGCLHSPQMLEQLKAALASLNLNVAWQIIDLGSLPPGDQRTGFGTPTILVDGVDLFGSSPDKTAAPT